MTCFDTIRREGRLLYEYVRGSHLYGLNTPQSDVDTSGVFICHTDELLGLFGYKAQVSDGRHDNTTSIIQEKIDPEFVNGLLLEIRHLQFTKLNQLPQSAKPDRGTLAQSGKQGQRGYVGYDIVL